MCFRCLNTFISEKSLASHHEYYKSHETIKIALPVEDRKKHIPSEFFYYIKCFDDTLYSDEPVTFEKNLKMTMLHKYL